MANFTENNIILKGKTQDLLRFINAGLKSKQEPECASLEEANGKVFLLSSWIPMPETFLGYDTSNDMRNRDSVNAQTLEPMFKSDEEYEEYVKGFKAAEKYQQETYGVIGWFDWSIQYWGCKWDSEVEIVDTNPEEEYIGLFISTPWNTPLPWCITISQEFNLTVLIQTIEEGGDYNFIANLDTGERIDADTIPLESFADEEEKEILKDEEHELYWEVLNDLQCYRDEKMWDMLMDKWVKKH